MAFDASAFMEGIAFSNAQDAAKDEELNANMEWVTEETLPGTLAVLPTGGGEGNICGIWFHAPLPTNSHVYKLEPAGLPDDMRKFVMEEVDTMYLFWQGNRTSDKWRLSPDKTSADRKSSDFGSGKYNYLAPDGVDKYSPYVASEYMFVWNPNEVLLRLARGLRAHDAVGVSNEIGGNGSGSVEKDQDSIPERLMVFNKSHLRCTRGNMNGARLKRDPREPKLTFKSIQGEYVETVMDWDIDKSSWVQRVRGNEDKDILVEEGEEGKFKTSFIAGADVWLVWDPAPSLWGRSPDAE